MRGASAVGFVEEGDAWAIHVTVGIEVDLADSINRSHFATVPGPSTALSIPGIVNTVIPSLRSVKAEMVPELSTASPGDHHVVGKVSLNVIKNVGVFPFRKLENPTLARVVCPRVDDALVVGWVEDIRLILLFGDCC